MVTSFWNLCDFLAFAPPLLELALRSHLPAVSLLAGIDLRWFKLLRCLVLGVAGSGGWRVGGKSWGRAVCTSEPSRHASYCPQKSGLSGGAK